MVSFVVLIDCFIDYHHNYSWVHIWSFWGIAKECQEVQSVEHNCSVSDGGVAEAQVFENKRHQLKNFIFRVKPIICWITSSHFNFCATSRSEKLATQAENKWRFRIGTLEEHWRALMSMQASWGKARNTHISCVQLILEPQEEDSKNTAFSWH